jgi:hypothetical protein
MVRKFTEEERRGQREQSERHYEHFHSGLNAGTICNSYAPCWTKREILVSEFKKRVLLDFDGPIHRYRYGWMDGTAYDEPTPGALEAVIQLQNYDLDVVVFSTRDAAQIVEWLKKNHFPELRVTNVKEPAEVLIDDRAIRFISWNQTLVDLEELHSIPKEQHP